MKKRDSSLGKLILKRPNKLINFRGIGSITHSKLSRLEALGWKPIGPKLEEVLPDIVRDAKTILIP